LCGGTFAFGGADDSYYCFEVVLLGVVLDFDGSYFVWSLGGWTLAELLNYSQILFQGLHTLPPPTSSAWRSPCYLSWTSPLCNPQCSYINKLSRGNIKVEKKN
jgi:hypothetical protein